MSTPNHPLKKYHRAAMLLSRAALFVTMLSTPLRAQEVEKKADPVEEEFSGPLAVVPEMVIVGDPGNPADPLTGLGAVQESFQIGKYDVTVLQWSTFLNAVHVIEGNLQDPRNLYHKEMFDKNNSNSFLVSLSGIVKKNINQPYGLEIYEDKVTLFFPKDWGTPRGHYYASLPMTGISIDDCKRYINWLHHGSPTFDALNDETLAITETGAYDFTNGKRGELMEGARYFLPSLNQWYKAAYYQAGSSNASYWRYPTQGNKLSQRTASYNLNSKEGLKTGTNFAEISPAWPHLKVYYKEEIRGDSLTTPVGTFKDSPGTYGAYDMGGNVRQWTGDSDELSRSIAPGGSYDEASDQLLSTNARKYFASLTGSRIIGLRVCAAANVSDHIDDLNSGEFTPDGSKTGLFTQSLINVGTAQITAYGLEAALSIGIGLYNRGELLELSEIIRPFTYQRNIVNTILSIALAASTTGEAHCMNITKADYYHIGIIVLSTIGTMCVTESGAFVVEAFIGKGLELLKERGVIDLTVQKSLDTLAWPRIFTNIWYIGLNTYYTTDSDLKFFNEQQLKLKASQ